MTGRPRLLHSWSRARTFRKVTAQLEPLMNDGNAWNSFISKEGGLDGLVYILENKESDVWQVQLMLTILILIVIWNHFCGLTTPHMLFADFTAVNKLVLVHRQWCWIFLFVCFVLFCFVLNPADEDHVIWSKALEQQLNGPWGEICLLIILLQHKYRWEVLKLPRKDSDLNI